MADDPSIAAVTKVAVSDQAPEAPSDNAQSTAGSVNAESSKDEATDGQPTAAGADDKVETLTRQEAEAKLLKQVEFYFSDINLPYDKFLWTLTRKDDGWVPLSTLASFKRMRPLREALTEEGILQLLQAQTKLLEVDAEGSRIRRKVPIERPTDSYERSIYAKGFPEETESLAEEIKVFFAEHCGHVNNVRLRRDDKEAGKPFKGSVFVEFASMDDMDRLMQEVKDGEQLRFRADLDPLQIMSKDDYCQMKMKEKGIEATSTVRGGGKGIKVLNPIKRPGNFNAFADMEKAAKEASGSDAHSDSTRTRKVSRSDPLEFSFNGKPLITRADETVDPDAVASPERSVVSFSGAGEGGNWRELKETLLAVADTSFVDFPSGAVSGAVGFKEPLTDDQLAQIQAKNIEVGGKPIVWARVGEDKAKQFYVDRANFRAKVLLDHREQENAGRGFGAGGRGAGRGGRGGRGNRGGRGSGRGGRGRGSDFRGRDDNQNRGGEKRKRQADEDSSGTKGGGAAPSLAPSKKAKGEDATTAS
ncbi:unnamed protein product [Jaminaea pallidilutea]